MKPNVSMFLHTDGIPPLTVDSMRGYFLHGHRPGGFLYAVLSNNLIGACQRADSANNVALYDIMRFLNVRAPIGSWGSPEAVTKWLKDFHKAA